MAVPRYLRVTKICRTLDAFYQRNSDSRSNAACAQKFE